MGFFVGRLSLHRYTFRGHKKTPHARTWGVGIDWIQPCGVGGGVSAGVAQLLAHTRKTPVADANGGGDGRLGFGLADPLDPRICNFNRCASTRLGFGFPAHPVHRPLFQVGAVGAADLDGVLQPGSGALDEQKHQPCLFVFDEGVVVHVLGAVVPIDSCDHLNPCGRKNTIPLCTRVERVRLR